MRALNITRPGEITIAQRIATFIDILDEVPEKSNGYLEENDDILDMPNLSRNEPL